MVKISAWSQRGKDGNSRKTITFTTADAVTSTGGLGRVIGDVEGASRRMASSPPAVAALGIGHSRSLSDRDIVLNVRGRDCDQSGVARGLHDRLFGLKCVGRLC